MKMVRGILGKLFAHNVANRKKSSKIKTRLILVFIILSLVPLIITAYYSYYESSNAIKNKISTYAVQVVAQIGENIDRELAKLEYDSVEIQFSNLVQNTLLNIDNMSSFEIHDAQNKMQNELVKKFSFLHDVSDVLLYTNNKEKIIAYGDRTFTLKLRKEFLDKFLEKVVNKKGMAVWAAINEEDEIRYVEYATSTELMNRNNGVIIGRAIRSLMHGDMIIGSLIIRTNERFFLISIGILILGQVRISLLWTSTVLLYPAETRISQLQKNTGIKNSLMRLKGILTRAILSSIIVLPEIII